MGEAMIARGSTSRKNPLDDVNIVAGYCSLLVRALDSTGKPIANLPVWCKDGTRNYNYNTNAGGYCIFQCNSGAANITAQNFSIMDKYNILDQSPVSANYDAPVGTKNMIEMKLKPINTNLTIARTVNAKFLAHNKINRLGLVGGGASGLDNGYGGGGGAYNEGLNVALDRSVIYNLYIGAGAKHNSNGASGGTTSAFGYSAVGGSKDKGGGSGSYRGGNGDNYSYTPLNYFNSPPTNLYSNYRKSNQSDSFKNFGYGGGRGNNGSSWASWRGWSNIIAFGGDFSTVTEYWDGTGATYYYASNGSKAPVYGGGGGGRSLGAPVGWCNVYRSHRNGYGGSWQNIYATGDPGAGTDGVILINF